MKEPSLFWIYFSPILFFIFCTMFPCHKGIASVTVEMWPFRLLFGRAKVGLNTGSLLYMSGNNVDFNFPYFSEYRQRFSVVCRPWLSSKPSAGIAEDTVSPIPSAADALKSSTITAIPLYSGVGYSVITSCKKEGLVLCQLCTYKHSHLLNQGLYYFFLILLYIAYANSHDYSYFKFLQSCQSVWCWCMHS